MDWAKGFKKELSSGTVKKDGERVLRSHEYFNGPGRRLWTIIKFDEENPRWMRGALVTQEDEKRQRVISWRAVLAEYLDGEWWFYRPPDQQVPTSTGDPVDVMQFPKERPIRMPHLDELPTDMLLILKDPEDMTSSELKRYMYLQANTSDQEKWIKQTNFHTRLAGPVALPDRHSAGRSVRGA